MNTVFIDEGCFDEENPSEYPDYVGISKLDIYDIPEELDESCDCDQEKIDLYANHRYLYPVVGQAVIGFDEDEEPNVIESELDNIQFAYPTI